MSGRRRGGSSWLQVASAALLVVAAVVVAVIAVSDLTRGLATAHAERDQWQRRALHLGQVQDHNERLRGVIAALLDHLVCEADRTMMQHWMDEIDREPQP